MQANPEYPEQWKRLRKIELMVVVGVVGFIPGGMTGALLIGRFTKDERFMATAPLGIMVFIFVNWLRYMFFRCPRCGKWFHSRVLGGLTRGRHCMHCDLPRYVA